SALLTGVALMLMGTGLLNTLVPLRGDAEGFSDQVLGLFGSAYFAGFMLGTWLCPRLAGWLMAGSATLLPLYFLAMFSACGLYSLWSWYHTRDRIVAAAARQVSMAHTVSAEALEMVVDEQKPDEEAGDPEVAR